ncbi:MAG: hypothetical protein PVS3B2_00990 [Candidatus Dormibacteraceae bacterium]
MVQIFNRSVATVQTCLIWHDAKSSANFIQLFWQPQAVELDEAVVRAEDSAEAAKRRRLSGAVLSEQDKDLAALNLQIDAGDGSHIPETLT